jgi:hypothetical protein
MSSNTVIPALVLSLAAVLSSDAYAAKTLIRVTPKLVGGNGFTFKMQPTANGKTRFQITANPSHSDASRSSELVIVRTTLLEVYDKKGVVASIPVAAHKRGDGIQVYEFVLDDEYAVSSTFTLAEIEEYRKDVVKAGRYIGGGTYYQFALLDFIDPEHEEKDLIERIKDSQERFEEQLLKSATELGK